MTTIQRTESVQPMDRFQILAGDIDQLRGRMEQLAGEQSIDDLLEVVEIQALAEKFDVSLASMKRRLCRVGGKVFKMGKKYVIRKIQLLEVMESLERDG